MKLSSFHLSTIRRVHVDFDLTAPKLDPDAVSLALRINPTNSARRGDERRNIKGALLQPHKEGWWQLSTKGKSNQKTSTSILNTYLRNYCRTEKTF